MSNVSKVVIAASIVAETIAIKMDNIQKMMEERKNKAQQIQKEYEEYVYDNKFRIPDGLPAELQPSEWLANELDGRDPRTIRSGYHWNPDLTLRACEKGNLNDVRYLLEIGNCPLEGVVGDYRTPLHYAVKQNKPEISMYLLRRGAGVHMPCFSEDGRNMLSKVSDDGNTNDNTTSSTRVDMSHVVKELITRGADVNHEAALCGTTPLIHFARKGDLKSVQHLLEAGANANYTNKDGVGALQVAKENKHEDIAQALIDAGACYQTDGC